MKQSSPHATGTLEPRRYRIVPRVTIGFWLAWLTVTHWPKIELPALSTLRFDKVVHFFGYAVLATLLSIALSTDAKTDIASRLRTTLIVLAIIALAGIVDELTQPYFGRGFEWGDYVADLCGGLVGTSIAARYLRTRSGGSLAP